MGIVLNFVVLGLLLLLPHFWVKVVFAAFFLGWAITFYLKRVRSTPELITDGIWWVPYYLVAGLGLLTFTENYRIFLSQDQWSILFLTAFSCCICAILFFWEWPPWFDKRKVLLDKPKRVFIAYLFFFLGLLVWLYAGACILNVACDTSKSVFHDTRISDKVTMGHKYVQDTQFIIFLEPWDGHSAPNSFFVTAQEFKSLATGKSIVRVWTKAGFFHSQWVTGFKILP